jgi:hypothetical protein
MAATAAMTRGTRGWIVIDGLRRRRLSLSGVAILLFPVNNFLFLGWG